MPQETRAALIGGSAVDGGHSPHESPSPSLYLSLSARSCPSLRLRGVRNGRRLLIRLFRGGVSRELGLGS